MAKGFEPFASLWGELALPRRVVIEAAGSGALPLMAAMAGARALERPGAILWCSGSSRGRPYGPGLARSGIAPERLIWARCKDDLETAWAMKEGLASEGVAVVVGELGHLDLTSSRRLQLAAERGGASGFVIRPRGAPQGPISAHHRWRARVAPSPPQPFGALGPPALNADLWRRRDGIEARFRIALTEPPPAAAFSPSPIPSPSIDMLSVRLGAQNVALLRPRASRDPLRADRWLAADRGGASRDRLETWLATGARPLRLFDPPEPARAIASAPDGPPARLDWRGRVFRIVAAADAERIAPEWWRDPSARPADHFRIETRAGLRLWVRREGFYDDPEPPAWRVIGLFC